jgi:hypothetical protein
MRLQVWFRDGNRKLRGSLGTAEEPTWSELHVVKRYLAVGSWSVTFPATADYLAKALLPSVGMVIEREGAPLISGPAETIRIVRTTEEGAPGTVTLSGGDDLSLVANRVALPDPSQPFTAQTAQARDVQVGNLEDVLWHYLNVNVGSGAITSRKVPWLTMASSLSRGRPVRGSARFDPLMDLVRSLQAAGGPLGVDVVQSGTDLHLSMYEPRDLTASMRFSWELGNLRSSELQQETPTTTDALVAGSGSGTARTFVQVSSGTATPWSYVETFVDARQTSDATELAQTGQDALAQGTANSTLIVQTLDVPGRQFGIDYGLGDKVTVEPVLGVTFADIVTAVKVDADKDGEQVQGVIGAAGTDGGEGPGVVSRLSAQLRSLSRRLAQLEAGQ